MEDLILFLESCFTSENIFVNLSLLIIILAFVVFILKGFSCVFDIGRR